MPRKTALINVMAQAAQRASRGLIKDFSEVEQLQVSRKGPGDFVSVADLKAERTIKEMLQRARPNFGFLMEESGASAGSDTSNRWIVDPLDGTMNFLHGIPHFATSIALERDGEVIAGVTYHPIADELYWAEKGIGAYLNGRRIRVSARSELADSLLGTGIAHGHGDDYDRFLGEVRTMMPLVASLRRFASATLDLAYVAAGRLDGFWQRGLGAWDLAAGMILIREAGGIVTDVDGSHRELATGGIIAGNDRLHGEILRLLQDTARK
jgi:myo-inositol-1(or 4)-monophosphatase